MIFVGSPLCASAQPSPIIISPINKLPLIEDPSDSQYSFWVTGHVYGSPQNNSGYPASTFLGNIATINGGSESFIVSTGDLFKNAAIDIPLYEGSLFKMLSKPFFNAVGEHDVSGIDYEHHFGRTYYSFTYHGDLFVVLDAEVEQGNIRGEQLRWFSSQVQSVDPGNAVFIFTHRPIWAEGHPLLNNVFSINHRLAANSNYSADILPILNVQQRTNPIYWFSGALGWNAPASFFYHKEKNTRIHYIQTAIRDLPRDAMLRTNVTSGHVEFETMSLTARESSPLEDYDFRFWQQRQQQLPVYYRFIPTPLESVITHHFFWFGILTLLGALLAWKTLRCLLSNLQFKSKT